MFGSKIRVFRFWIRSETTAGIKNINIFRTSSLTLLSTKERCRTNCSTFWVKTSDIRCKTSDMSGKIGFFIFTAGIVLHV